MLGGEGLLAAGRLPAVDEALHDPAAEEEVGRAIAAVAALRGWRDRVQVRPGAVVPAVLEAPGYEATLPTVAHLARIGFTADGGAAAVASVAVPGGAVGVLPSPDVDVEAAERRLEARREELRGELRRAEGKLANERFVERAPAHVVEAERAKLARLAAELEAL